jgi:serine/threonine protein kinase
MAGLEGTRLGDYELVEQIGSGGMAEVYRARQLTAFGREVALKVIRPGFSGQDEFRTRFLREAQSISRLSHPNILPLIEFGEENQALYLVMPLIREGTLRDLIKQRRGPLPVEEALPLFTQLCSAIQYAHTQGIIHRDIKPQNVLLQQHTHVLLGDFGIARDRAEKTITATGAGVGSAEYMAPEQATGQADTRSDIYSLGIVLYQMLTDAVPYTGSTPIQVLVKHTTASLPDPRTLNPALSPRIVQVLQTALAKAPDERFQSAQALARAVQQGLTDAPAPSSMSMPGWSQPSNPAISPATTAPGTPAGPTRPTGPAAPYEPGAVSQPSFPSGAYDTRATSQYGQQPPANVVTSPRSGFGPTPTSPQSFGAPPAGFSGSMNRPALPQPAPAYPVPGYPGAPAQPSPTKKKNGLIALISAIVLVALVGGILLTLGLTKTGPFAPPGVTQQATPTPTPTPTASSIPAGFKLFTNRDKSFSIIYPQSWSSKSALSPNGVGEEFDGPANQIVQAVNGGQNNASNTGSNVDAFCVVYGGLPQGHSTVTIDGQKWTREECDSFGSVSHAVVEAVVYKGNLYLLSYAAPKNSFSSDRTKYFTPMEQSFTFLT